MRLRRALPCLFVVITGLAASRSAEAQEGFAVNRFEPAERGSDWFTLDSLDLRTKRDMMGKPISVFPAAGVTTDYNFRSLGVYESDGTLRAPVVDNQLVMHVGASVAFVDRVRFGVDMPFVLFEDGSTASVRGDTYKAPAHEQALGDLRLGADVRLYGKAGEPFTIAAGGLVWLPTGDQASYTSDGTVRVAGRVQVAGDAGPIAYAARLSIEFRGLQQTYANSTTAGLGSELGGAASVGVRLLDRKLLVGPEVYATTVATDGAWFGKQATPVEGILGAHYRVSDFVFGAGVGAGLTRGLGAPEVRALFSFEWAPKFDAVKDTDGDGVFDDVDACIHEPGVMTSDPRTNGCPPDADHDGVPDGRDACPKIPGLKSSDPKKNGCPPDGDNDGVFDSEDACPTVAGMRSADPKKNGCPPDGDEDGVPDTEDACPTVAGIRSDDPKKNGCPPDRDNDGIPDGQDACPDVPGIQSTNPKFNGCPLDKDGDGVPNEQDACPDEPGKPDPDPKRNGCPKAFIQNKQIKILDQVKFKTGSAEIIVAKDSVDVLQAVLKVLNDHPEVKKVRVEGHTDNRGTAAMNKKLSTDRAASVVKWLVQHGIDPNRLTSAGFGLERPIATNDTEEGRKENRRVEFHIEETP